jgi:predicted DNA-binding transcriptional regulator AlpA
MDGIILLEGQQLKAALRSVIYDALTDLGLSKKDDDELLDEAAVRSQYGVSHSGLYRWAKTGKLVPLKMGYKNRWRKSDIETFLQRKEA